MAYKNQWKAFEDINKNQQKHLSNLGSLCAAFAELSNVEKHYVDGLVKIEFMVASLNDIGSLGKIFEMFKQNIHTRKELHSSLEQTAKTLFVKDQLALFETEQSRNQDWSNKQEVRFNEMVEHIKVAKKNYDKYMDEIERELTSAIERNVPEEIEKKKENCINKEKIFKATYCEIILNANKNRDEYEKEINELLKECEIHDQLYLVSCANKFSTYFCREKEILKQLSAADEEMYTVCCEINAEADLNEFSKKNHRHGQPPNSFDFDTYQLRNDFWSKQINLPQLKIYKHELRDFFKKNFSYYPPEGLLDKTLVDKYRKLEERAAESWAGTTTPEDLIELKEALRDRKLAGHYLKYAHQARVNLKPLSIKAYTIIVELMLIIINSSLESPPYNYDYIYQIILLSQTFYMLIDEAKPNTSSNQKFLQTEIMKEALWKRKDLWIGLLDYAFETEMRKDSKTISDTLSNRIIKENTIMLITLTTFKFIMTNYSCEMKLIKEILSEYCAEYNIDETLIMLNEEKKSPSNSISS